MKLFRYRYWSLRNRLIVLIPSITLLFMLATTALFDILNILKDEKTINQQILVTHQFLLNDMAEIILTGNPDVVASFSEKLQTQSELSSLVLLDDERQALFQYGQEPISELHLEDFYRQLIDGIYFFKLPVVLYEQELGFARYYYQKEAITQRLVVNLLANLTLLPFMLIFSIFLSIKVAKSFARPIEELVVKMSCSKAELGEHKLPENTSSEEINRLYSGFNRLQKRIKETLSSLQSELEHREYAATHDNLTGLYNRHGFDERVQHKIDHLLQKQEPVFAFLDLDQFKIINDTVGHLTGDIYLKQLAGYLQDWLPEGGLVGRFGGDEFAILLPNFQDAEQQTQDLLDIIHQQRFIWQNKHFQLGASVGLVKIETGKKLNLMQIYQWATAACYTAKELGRNRYQWHQQEDEDVSAYQQDIQVLNQVRSALSTGPEQFELWAQTIVPLKPELQDDLHHYEILIRMRDAEGNIISPALFLPAAERHGELLHLDTWVLWTYLETVTKQPQHIQKLGFVDINITGAALVHQDFYTTMVKAIEYFGFPWHKLTLEVTETTAVRNFEQARKLINFCKSHGIRFALDDFGSGMASFDYLKKLPFDVIKIDGSFIKNIVDNPVDEAMVKFMVHLTEMNNQLTVAEFVENEAIVEKLIANGVHYAQGYHFGAPKPLSEWTKLDK